MFICQTMWDTENRRFGDSGAFRGHIVVVGVQGQIGVGVQTLISVIKFRYKKWVKIRELSGR
jgi:hypothetical protein